MYWNHVEVNEAAWHVFRECLIDEVLGTNSLLSCSSNVSEMLLLLSLGDSVRTSGESFEIT
jgi:hypothetical protein